jgi:RimJ/RimL family protein N-acetyltransferase
MASVPPKTFLDRTGQEFVIRTAHPDNAAPVLAYVAVKDGRPLGTCGFMSPPVDGRVEIAYFTFPGNEGQGIATAMATELVKIAEQPNRSSRGRNCLASGRPLDGSAPKKHWRKERDE